MNYTDEKLKKMIAKMLPDVISYREVTAYESGKIVCLLQWGAEWDYEDGCTVRETEFLHLCWLVEENLTEKEYYFYADVVCDLSLEIVTKRRWFWLAMPWQQRVEALAKVKGVELNEEWE